MVLVPPEELDEADRIVRYLQMIEIIHKVPDDEAPVMQAEMLRLEMQAVRPMVALAVILSSVNLM